MRVWTTVRTESEIRRNLSEPLRGDEAGLVAYWRFDEGSALTAHDSNTNPNAQDGQLIGGTAWALGDVPYQWTVNENTTLNPSSKSIFLPAFDVDSASLTYTIVSGPSHGTLTGTGANRTYTPTLNYNGSDSFSYRVSDGPSTSGTVTVSISIEPVNTPPTISNIANQLIEEDTDIGQIAFTVGDVINETAPGDLQVSTRLLDTTVVAFQSIELGGSGANRWIKLTPEQGEIDTVTVLLTVFDGTDTTSTQFDLQIVPRPAYAVVDIGTLEGRVTSGGWGLNDRGEAVGYSQLGSGWTGRRAYFYNGIENGGKLTDLGTLGGPYSEAFGINDAGQIVGEALNASGQRRAFLYENSVMTDLGAKTGGSYSRAYGVNQHGDVAGEFAVGGKGHAFFYDYAASTVTDLGTLAGGTVTYGLAVNDAGKVAGYGDVTGGAKRAFLWNGSTKTLIPLLADTTDNYAMAINDAGAVAGYAMSGNSPRAFFYAANSQLQALGFLPSGAFSVAYAVNTFSQVVGRAGNARSESRAFLFSAAKMHDLNDLIPEDTGWTLTEARAVNRHGFITGTGKLRGQDRAFLSVPAWVIGRPVARPQGTIAQMPLIEVLSGDGGADNSFFWSLPEKRLYAVRPVTARLSWFVSQNPADTNRVVTVGISVWPKQPTIHVALTPVEVEPKGVSFDYTYQTILYNTADGVRVDLSSKQFTATQPGYAVLLYLKTMGYSPNPEVHKPILDVVRTVRWDDRKHLTDGITWWVGEPLTNPLHTDYLGKNGYVFFEKACYDGAGPDRAYDRNTRLGPIIPVNQDTPAPEDDLVVVWYRTNQIGVAWSSLPHRYSLEWPEATAPKIIIASGLGSRPLDPLVYPQMKVYKQPDHNLPGYNPNEEHALLAPSSTGQALYALRCDLNALIGASAPYTLLKHKDPATQQWRIKVFRVMAEEDPYHFQYAGEAGKEIQPPMPLSVLPLCDESQGVAGPYWEDWKGKLYARAAGPEGLATNVVLQWFYPLQPGFFYDLDGDGTNNVPEGASLAWLNRLAGGSENSPPIDVTYTIRWPDEVPILQIGETLLTAKRGLPGVKDMARAQVIFDDLDPNDTDPATALARLFDPLSARTVKLEANFKMPDDLKRLNVSGKEVFTDLPYALRARLSYDPINKWLSWAGFLDESGVGEPLLLPNLMTARERDRIKAATSDPTATAWCQAVDDLYALTRNPNQVDLDPDDGQPDQALRLGLTTFYETNHYTVLLTNVTANPGYNPFIPGSTRYLTNVTSETREQVVSHVATESLGDLPKALTAALADAPPAQPRPHAALQFAAR